MSVNIPVNGRYEKGISKKPSLLDDSERVRKDLESERRILRLRQVRQESNNLARKIRKEVDEEKQRQLKKLEDIKQKELNCWRQHVMVEKHNDFRAAVFQVGAAHRAAVEENETKQIRKEQLNRPTKPKGQFPNKTKPTKESQQKENECGHQSTENSTAKSSHHDCCAAAQKNNNTNKRRKLNKCCRKKPKQNCKHSDDSTGDVSLLSSDSTSSFHLSSDSEETNSSDKKNNLKKTDAVILEVDIESDESVSVSTKGAIEINDKFIETNRRFCRVVQKDTPQRDNKKLDQKTTKTNHNDDDLDVEHRPNRPKPTTIRFTQISDFVKQCSEMENIGSSEKSSRQQTVDGNKNDETSPSEKEDVRPPPPSTRGPPESDNPNYGNLVNAGVSSAPKRSVSTSTVVIRHTKNSASSLNSARVKFYDYNNKYHKDYEQSSKSVQANLNDTAQLNAMDHAQIENQLQQLRELEIEKLRKITEQRCEKALEREQVRRDCAELTEKLESLSRQHPQLLQNDANFVPSHRFVDLTISREKKMDEIMEKMLLRPAIITCPEVTSKPEGCNAARPLKERAAINLGDRWTTTKDSTSASSESCCSLLLECVDDQTKKLRCDLKETGVNAEKAEKLRNLLERIEQIRESLMKELKTGNVQRDGENVQNIIEQIRLERSAILSDKQRSLDARESSLLKKEALLDKKIRALYDAKKACGDGTKKNEQKVENGQVIKHSTEKPLEIIIKVTSDGQVKKCIAKPKGIKKIATKPTIQPPTTQKDMEQTTVTGVQRENSYDSNSTAYRSLPPTTANQTIDTLVQQLAAQTPPAVPEATSVNTAVDGTQTLNPIVIHYVQRLLGMTRKSIQELGVSSSEVTTPASSIINTSRNMSVNASVDESLIDEKRMKHVEDFIEDNRSFVHELEDTLRSHGNQSLESSMRVFDKIWIKRLEGKCNENSVKNQTTNSKIKSPEAQTPSLQRQQVLKSATKSITHSVSINQEHTRNEEKVAKINKLKDNTHKSPISRESAVNTCTDSEKHIERYAKLTENCTQRIAELTDLIHKVREEKQRLLEVTLTSTSDAGRNSTEYFELPTGQREDQRARTNSERSKASETHDNRTTSTSETIPLSDNEPLQKHKLIGASRDSGIYESRPVTSQDQDAEVEPTSIGSSSKGVVKQRRDKQYSTTFQHLSPNMIEERQVHELSTIVEVDTPAPSSVKIKAAGNNTTLKEANASLKIGQPVKFPSFKQYAQELNLDISQISNDQSLRLQHEYNELLLAINQRSNNGVSYQEFPSIRAYLHNVTSTNFQTVNEGSVDLNSPQTIRELIQTLRMANIKIRSFPTQKEYMQKLLANKPENERDLIDSTSLENTTDYANAKQQIDSDTTDSFNVEAELKKRKILKASFQRTAMSTGDCVASSTQRDSAAFFTGALPSESGIEKLSGSQYDAVSDEIDREMQRLGMQWPATMRKRQKQAEALSSGSSDDHKRNPRPRKRNSVSQLQKAASSSTVSNESGDFGRTLNLREFLTKELLKHVNQDVSSSSDDSLKSNFLQSVLDSLTPSGGTPPTNNGMGTGTAITLDRQKTSTPVLSPRSSHTQSRSSPTTTQLFSGESKLSSVHYHKKEPSSHPNSRTDN